MTTCREIMSTQLVTCEQHESITSIARKLDAANVGSIPVVYSQDTQELAGIITDRDIATRVVAANLNPNTAQAIDVMSIEPITCHPDDNVTIAMRKMAEHQIRRIPVVNDGNILVGIIAQADVARYADSKATGLVVGEISEETATHQIPNS